MKDLTQVGSIFCPKRNKPSQNASLFKLEHSRSVILSPLTMSVLWAVVVAQLVEQLLLIPEVRGLTPVIDKILLNICLLDCLLSTVLKRRK